MISAIILFGGMNGGGKFQSLIGILDDFSTPVDRLPHHIVVSIPDRDFR